MTLKEIITNLKYNNPYIYKCLIEDIEIYLQALYEPIRNWKHSKLNLTKEEIIILRDSIKNKNNLYIDELNEKIINYINKIKYKIILEKNYCEIEDIVTNGNIRNRLKAAGIKTVGELIELNDRDMHYINKLGAIGTQKIKDSLEEKNIIFLDNSKLVEQMLQKENAGIICYKQSIKSKEEELEEELKHERKIYIGLKSRIAYQENRIKELEEELKNIKQKRLNN